MMVCGVGDGVCGGGNDGVRSYGWSVVVLMVLIGVILVVLKFCGSGDNGVRVCSGGGGGNGL